MSNPDNDGCDGCLKLNELTNIRIGLPCLITAICGELVCLLLVWLIHRTPVSQNEWSDKALAISRKIQSAAFTFIKWEYSVLACLVAGLFILVSAAVNWQTGICYLCGAVTSAICGFLGMWVCTSANAKTALACEQGLNKGLRVAFNAGSVMGLTVVSFGLGTLSVLLMAFGENAIRGKDIGGNGALAGFGMGASTVSIIARVGGGIYTKAADVGADLVGKVEKNLPEDDPRNPATIADNVGDNVGDVAGMGADLYSSFVGSMVASALLGYKRDGQKGIALPFWISLSGIVAAIFGIAMVRTHNDAEQKHLLNTLRTAQIVAGIFQVGFIAATTAIIDTDWEYFVCIVIGLVAGLFLGILSEFFTSYAYPPTLSIASSARIGPANVIIQGISVGMYSCIMPALIIASVIIACMSLAGSYGIALASTGLLSTLGITLATDAYGPVADNAGGIAEMTHMPPHTRQRTDLLDALGNTTAAIGKGFAVGSAVLTAVSLLNTYFSRLGSPQVDPINDHFFIAGSLVGAMFPFFFGALTMGSVNKAATAVVCEVRRQFAKPGVAEGTVESSPEECVAMISKAALHSMVFPVLLVVLGPIIGGVGLGPTFLLGFLIGAIICGFMTGLMMGTAGGSWDNAKKYIESNKHGGKRSAAHKAAVVGDTVGDPFKDTTGPAINILIKLMSYISVVLASVFKKQADFWWAALIILGVLVFFVPFWMYLTPKDLTHDVIEKVISDLNKEAASEAPSPTGEADKAKEHKENTEQQPTVEMGGTQVVRYHSPPLSPK